MGSMNFAHLPALPTSTRQWKFDWEEPYLRGTDDFIFRNTFRDIERILKLLGEDHGTKFELECYDVGHLYNLAHFVDKGLVKPPFFVQMIFGILGGIGAGPRQPAVHEAHRRQAVRRRLRLVGAGRRPAPDAVRHAIGACWAARCASGWRIRSSSAAASSPAAMPSRWRRSARSSTELGQEIATPAEARAMLGLKGGDLVGF